MGLSYTPVPSSNQIVFVTEEIVPAANQVRGKVGWFCACGHQGRDIPGSHGYCEGCGAYLTVPDAWPAYPGGDPRGRNGASA